jgi:hypothetical protein
MWPRLVRGCSGKARRRPRPSWRANCTQRTRARRSRPGLPMSRPPERGGPVRNRSGPLAGDPPRPHVIGRTDRLFGQTRSAYDGAVESGNKLVVEARLKGSGMHWARPHVDPLLALRDIACNDRWEEAWPQITRELRRQTRQRTLQRHQTRLAQTEAKRLKLAAVPEQQAMATPPLVEALTTGAVPEPTAKPALDQPKERWKPAANHPWRQPFLLKTKRQLTQSRHP